MSMVRESFPLNGRIAILDNEYDEVKALTHLFAKYGVPYIYYSGSYEEHNDDNNALGIRLFIADIVLGTNTDEKSVKSTLIQNFNNIIKENNGPYILAFWSTREEKYDKIIKEVIGELPLPPIETLNLDKTNYAKFDISLEEKFEKDVLNKLSSSLFLSYVSQWENCVNEAILSTIDSVAKLVPANTNPNKYAKAFAAIPAKMLLENQLAILKNEQRLVASIDALNMMLQQHSKYCSHNIAKNLNEKIIVTEFDPQNKTHLNTLMWISPIYDFRSPQNVYKSEIDEIIKKYITSELLTNSIAIDIDITHKCDFVQNKNYAIHQFVKGILLEDTTTEIKLKDSFYLIGNFNYIGKDYRFIVFLCDTFNYFEEKIDFANAIFSISDDVHNEIRTKIAGFYGKTAKIKM